MMHAHILSASASGYMNRQMLSSIWSILHKFTLMPRQTSCTAKHVLLIFAPKFHGSQLYLPQFGSYVGCWVTLLLFAFARVDNHVFHQVQGGDDYLSSFVKLLGDILFLIFPVVVCFLGLISWLFGEFVFMIFLLMNMSVRYVPHFIYFNQYFVE